MKGALSSMLAGVIDYAGLFPPAKLSMTEAVDHYLGYIHGPEKWLVSRFVCSTGRLPELARELAEHPEEPFVPVAVIGHASTDRKSWEHALAHDADVMTKFIDDSEGHAEIQAYEVRVPDREHLEAYCRDLNGFSDVDVFVELPWGAGVGDLLALIAETEWLGAKGRTGGVESSAFPPSDLLAEFIQQCLHLDVSFKLTAGLHHPVRRFDASVDAKMFGFLNVLTATAMCDGHDLSRDEVTDILEEEDGAAFTFTDSDVRWRDLSASKTDIEQARDSLVSYGSCSVTEPIEELKQLGLLEGVAV